MKLTEVVVVFVLFTELCVAISYNEIAILKQMQDWGKAIFLSIESGMKKGQYLVAAVSVDDPSPASFPKYLLNGCPAEPDIDNKILECRSTAVILNLVSTEVWERSQWANKPKYRNHPWHGEYRLLMDGIVGRLTDNFLADRPNAQCKIYLYSFYIPCADIPGQPYSCSDIISDYNNAQTTRCKVALVGYTEVFRRSDYVKTNEERSQTVLEAYSALKHIKMEVKTTAIEAIQTNCTFQQLMFECVINSPLLGCCDEDQSIGPNSRRIVSYFVNAMIFNVKSREEIANSGMNKSTKQKLMKFIDTWLSNIVGGDCRQCSARKEVPRYLLGFCAQTALDLSDYLGQPEEQYDLSIPRWTPLENGKMSNIKMIDPSEFKNTRMLMCAQDTLSIDSLCTRSMQSSEYKRARRD